MRGMREAVCYVLIAQESGLYMPDGTGAYKMIAGQDKMASNEAKAEKRKIFNPLNEREKWCRFSIECDGCPLRT